MGRIESILPTTLFHLVVQTLCLQPILKGLPGDADYVADADCLEQSGVDEFIGRSAADAENIYLSYLGCLRCHSQGAIEIYLASNRY